MYGELVEKKILSLKDKGISMAQRSCRTVKNSMNPAAFELLTGRFNDLSNVGLIIQLHFSH